MSSQPVFSQPEEAGFLPVAQLSLLVAKLMALGYQCLGPSVENGAIVIRELDAPDRLARTFRDAAPCLRVIRDENVTTVAYRYKPAARSCRDCRDRASAGKSASRPVRSIGGTQNHARPNRDKISIGVSASHNFAMNALGWKNGGFPIDGVI